jgi:hypothetical protein
MKGALTGLGVGLLLVGGVWFFQGIGLLPGSFMTGQTKWAVIGGITGVVGVAALVFARR